MLKRTEVGDQNSCLNRAGDDEMIFVLLARDASAPVAIRSWCADRVRSGKNHWGDPQILEALECADPMDAQRVGARGDAGRAPIPPRKS